MEKALMKTKRLLLVLVPAGQTLQSTQTMRLPC
jgi:hypothetical protein